MSSKKFQSLAFSPVATLVAGTVCTLALLPFASSEITEAYMMLVQGTAMPTAWCPGPNFTVPDIAVDRAGSLLSCSGQCTRMNNCGVFCIIGSLCNTFSSKVAPYFLGWTDDPHIVYDLCYTAWPGDPLNMVKPGLAYTSSGGDNPKFIMDGIVCKKVAGFKGTLSPGPYLTIDFGTSKQVSVLKYVVISVSTVEDLHIALGNSLTFSNNKEIVVRAGPPVEAVGEEEVFTFSPPESGRYLSFYRMPASNAKMFIGDVTAYADP